MISMENIYDLLFGNGCALGIDQISIMVACQNTERELNYLWDVSIVGCQVWHRSLAVIIYVFRIFRGC